MTQQPTDAHDWAQCVEQLLGPRHIGDDPEVRKFSGDQPGYCRFKCSG